MKYSITLSRIFLIIFLLLVFHNGASAQCCSWSSSCGLNSVNPGANECPCNQHCCDFRYEELAVGAQCVNENPYKLIFSDEFDGQVLNPAYWYVYEGKMGEEAELQYYTKDNLSITPNGELKMHVEKEIRNNQYGTIDGWINWGPENFSATSASIKSKFKMPYNFGLIEARIKCNNSSGLRPAFWLYNGDGWNEIDIFEFDEPTEMNMNLIKDIVGDPHPIGHCKASEHIDSRDYHLYSCVYNPSYIAIFVDWELVRFVPRWYGLNGAWVPCPFESGETVSKRLIYPEGPMEIRFNVKMKTLNGTAQSSDMLIDYVRYYMRAPCDLDYTINNSNMIPNQPGVFNYIIGRNITLDLNYTMQPDQFLKIIATENITTKPGFNGNMLLEHQIQQNLCVNPFPFSVVTPTTIDSIEDPNKHYKIDQTNYFSNLDFNAIPNPATTSVKIISSDPNNRLRFFKIKIYDSNGKIIRNLDTEYLPFEISLTDFSAGLYLIQIERNSTTLETIKLNVQ